MPNYDFKCKKCGHKFAKTVSYQEKDKTTCPECGGSVTQLFNGFLYAKSGNPAAAAAGGGSCGSGSCSGCSGC